MKKLAVFWSFVLVACLGAWRVSGYFIQ